MRGCNYTPFFIGIFSPLAWLDQKTAFWICRPAGLCMLIAVLILARGSASPLGAAPTIIVLSLVLLSRPFTAPGMESDRADAAGATVRMVLWRGTPGSPRPVAGARGVAEAFSCRSRRIFFVLAATGATSADDRFFAAGVLLTIPRWIYS